MNKLGFVLLFSIFLISCGTAPEKQYSNSVANSSNPALTSKEAIDKSKHIEIKEKEIIRAEIRLEDPTIQYGGIISNYKIFKINAKQNKKYTIELRTLCSCFSWTKHILFPVAYLMDSNGNTINSKPIKFEKGSEGLTLPANLHLIFEGRFPENDTYYFMIAADNSNIGEPIITYQNGFTIDSYPTGDIIISYNHE